MNRARHKLMTHKFICKDTHNFPFFRIFAAIFNKQMK